MGGLPQMVCQPVDWLARSKGQKRPVVRYLTSNYFWLAGCGGHRPALPAQLMPQMTADIAEAEDENMICLAHLLPDQKTIQARLRLHQSALLAGHAHDTIEQA